MAEIITLRQARKAMARAVKEATAAANRVAFGRSKAEKTADKAAIERRERQLDGARRDD